MGLFNRYQDFTHEVGFTLESFIWIFYVGGFRNMQVHDAISINEGII